jgi:4-carboxymuconolactone decarboxylase
MPDSTTDKAPSAAAKMFGDFAPALVHFTDDVLFGEVWKRPDLAPRDRSQRTERKQHASNGDA